MNTRPYTIFYTDDDADDQDFFREVIAEIGGGHQVHTQDGGDELLRLLDNPPPDADVIFLDLNMPQKNGHQVLEEIRRSPRHKHLPIVIFSTSDDAGMIEKSKALGASMYVSKPTSYQRFRQILAAILAMDWKNRTAIETEFLYPNR